MAPETNLFWNSPNPMLGSTLALGQTSSSSNTGFSTKPVGMTTSLGWFPPAGVFGATVPSSSIASASIFGTPTGAFGATAPSPSMFGTSTSAFGATQPSSSVASTSIFGTSHGVFGANPPASSGTSASISGSSPFGANQPSSSGTSASIIGTSTSVFGANLPASSGTSASVFGISTGPFGANQASSSGTSASIFGNSTNAFGVTLPSSTGTSASIYGNSTGVFGADPSCSSAATKFVFGPAAPTSNAFSTPTFGGNSSYFGAFGQTSSPSYTGFSTKPAGMTTSLGWFPPAGVFGATLPSSSVASASILGTPTGAFGATVSSPSMFGTSTGAFGATQPSSSVASTSIFGTSHSVLGVNPPTSSSPSASVFGILSGPFGANQPSSSGTSASIFGTSTGVFGANLPASSGTLASVFGISTGPFGANQASSLGTSASIFGNSTNVFGVTLPSSTGTSASIFGNSTGVLGADPSCSSAATKFIFGPTVPTSNAFSTPTFGGNSSYLGAFGKKSAGGFGSSSVLGHANSTISNPLSPKSSLVIPFGSSTAGSVSGKISANVAGAAKLSPFFTSASPYSSTLPSSNAFSPLTSGVPPSSFSRYQNSDPSLICGKPLFDGQHAESKATPYMVTNNFDAEGKCERFVSISAMPVYENKSHEELRWNDYQLGSTRPFLSGYQNSAPLFTFWKQPSDGQHFEGGLYNTSTQSFPFTTQIPASNAPVSAYSFPQPSLTVSQFTSPTFVGNVFSSTSGGSLSDSWLQTAPFNPKPSINSSPSTTSGFVGNLFPSPLSQPLTSGLRNLSASCDGQPPANSSMRTTQNAASIAPASYLQSGIIRSQSTGLGGMGNGFSSSMNQLSATSVSINPSTVATSSTTSSSPFLLPSMTWNFSTGQPNPPQSSVPAFTQSASNSVELFSDNHNQSGCGQLNVADNIIAVRDPFGTQAALSQPSVGDSISALSIQHGICSIPVQDKPASVRTSSFLASRHISRQRMLLHARKYQPKRDGPMVAFFSHSEKTSSVPKPFNCIVPRQDPRSVLVSQFERLHFSDTRDNASPQNDASTDVCETDTTKISRKSSNHQSCEVHNIAEAGSLSFVNKVSEAANEDKDKVKALLPKLQSSDYYTEPAIQELAAMEMSKPGSCGQVKDFVVGRHGYGRIKFEGVTDVRGLHLDSVVIFNNRKVIVYADMSNKPPVGQGLNRPAEITLLNIKCINKKTGVEYTSGPDVEKYLNLLKKKTEQQGAEFVSYDPVKGEWKFRVGQFS